MKIILAGPGTGKTTKVKTLIREDYAQAKNILVLSFTNATIDDLKGSFKDFSNVSCYTLHSYALKINHLPTYHVLDYVEYDILKKYSDKVGIEIPTLCDILECFRFQDMIKQCIKFIGVNSAYASDNIGQLDLLIVDEFQDFNEVERELVCLLSNYASETLVLGDDDQSIYGFKDADPDGIISLYNDDKIEKIPHDNICYRCPDVIVEQGSQLIKNNLHRVKKDWKTSNKKGEVVFEQKMTQKENQEYICSQIKQIQSNTPQSSILVLSPVRYYISELIELLEAQGIKCVDFWTTKITPQLRKKIWMLKSLYGKHRIIFILLAGYTFGIHNKVGYINALKTFFKEGADEQEFIERFASYFPKPYSDYLLESIPIDDFLSSRDEFQELGEYIDGDNVIESVDRLERTINPAQTFENDAVNIMSIHKSKGLQANYVFIAGLNEGVLPNDTRGTDSIEAQRRLLFVGMTRALKKLYLISTVEWEGKFVNKMDKKKFKYEHRKKTYCGKTSRFIEEISQ